MLARNGDLLAVAAYIVLLGLVGGGLAVWSPGYVAIAVATIVFATWYAARDGFVAFAQVPATGRIALAGIAAWPLFQLVPLPPAVWQSLPGQSLRLETLRLAGAAGSWQPLSLEPVSTALAALLAIGFVVLTGALLRLGDAAFRRILYLATGLVATGMAMGLLQVVGNGFPHFQVTNMGATMLGFFANKNHMALAIACSILLVGLIVGRDWLHRDKRRMAVIGYTIVALVCIVTTNSRAGLVLGGVAALVVLADQARGVPLRWRIAALVALALLVVGVLSSTAFETVSGRVGDVDGDLRWKFLVWSLPLAERYGWLGSGAGSFATLFAAHEQIAWLKPTFVNAVHNDYLQLAIEFGIPGVVLLLLLAASVLGRIPAWRVRVRREPQRGEMTFGFVTVALFALHAAVDYPVRRPAAWLFLALALAAIYRGASATQGDAGRGASAVPNGRRDGTGGADPA